MGFFIKFFIGKTENIAIKLMQINTFANVKKTIRNPCSTYIFEQITVLLLLHGLHNII